MYLNPASWSTQQRQHPSRQAAQFRLEQRERGDQQVQRHHSPMQRVITLDAVLLPVTPSGTRAERLEEQTAPCPLGGGLSFWGGGGIMSAMLKCLLFIEQSRVETEWTIPIR